MTKNKPNIKPLIYVVHQVMSDLDESDTSQFSRYLQWAIFCCTTEIHLKYSPKIKVVYLTMSDIKTVDLPEDYIDYTKIGYVSGGKIINLGMNNNILLPRKVDDCGNAISDALENDCGCGGGGIAVYGYTAHFRGGTFVGELYGLGGGFARSYYRIDEEKQQIVFSSEVPNGEIILEYRSSGIEKDGSILVDLKCLAAIRAYIHWMRLEHNPGIGIAEKERGREMFNIELGKLTDMENRFSIAEYLDMHYSTTKQGPKR